MTRPARLSSYIFSRYSTTTPASMDLGNTKTPSPTPWPVLTRADMTASFVLAPFALLSSFHPQTPDQTDQRIYPQPPPLAAQTPTVPYDKLGATMFNQFTFGPTAHARIARRILFPFHLFAPAPSDQVWSGRTPFRPQFEPPIPSAPRIPKRNRAAQHPKRSGKFGGPRRLLGVPYPHVHSHLRTYYT